MQATSRSLAFAAIPALGVGVLMTRWWRRRGDSRPPYPPSPPAHGLLGTLLGNVMDLPDPSKDAHVDLKFMEWSKKYGKVFSITLPIVGRLIVIADPAWAKHVLISKNYRKSPTLKKLADVIGKRSILVAPNKEWYRKRRAFNPGFSPDFLKGVVSVIVGKCDRFVKKCAADAEKGAETNLRGRAIDFTADVIAQVAFGEEWGSDGDDDEPQVKAHALMVRATEEVAKTALSPLKRTLDLLARWRVRKLVGELDREMSDVVRRRIAKVDDTSHSKANGKGDGRRDILSIAMSQRRTKGPMGPEEIDDVTAQLKTFYFAGHDTTSTLISWTIWLVAQHPAVGEKIRAEAISLLGEWAQNQLHPVKKGADDPTSGRVPPEEPAVSPSYDALQRCTYLEAALKESLRLYPPAGMTRYCDDPTAEFGGYRLGPCVLYVSCYMMHRHPDLWDEPDAFLPERFLDVDDVRGLNAKFMPFSQGPRDCIGRYFAMLEAKVAVAALLLNFDVEAVDVDEEVAYRLTSHPRNGARVKFSRRTFQSCQCNGVNK